MKLLAIDGNSVFYRAFYGVRLLSTKDGIFTNAIYGFLNILLKEIEINSPDRILVAFDLPSPTFRHLEYDGYKAGRKPSPDELRMQMPIIQEILPLMGISVLTQEGYEADDILGTISRICEEQDQTCVIITGDRDSLQLVSDRTTVRLASTKGGAPLATVYNKDKIKEEYGVDDPIDMIEIKGLMGDSSDNLPGVAGVGPKSACSLIANFGSIENIYSNIDTLPVTDSVKKKLILGRDNAFLSKKMATICRTVPIDENLDAYNIEETDKPALANILTKLELRTVIKRLGLNDIPTVSSSSEPTHSTNSRQEIYVDGDSFLSLLEDDTKILPVWDEDTSTLYVAADDDIYIIEDGESSYISLLEQFTIIAPDAKKVYKYAFNRGITCRGISFCITLAAYLLSPESSDYSAYAVCLANGFSYDTKSEMASALLDCSHVLMERIEKMKLEKVLYDIELPLSKVLASMEKLGIKIDASGISEYGKMLDIKLDSLEKNIYEQAGCVFNINSPKQLGQILFESLGLPAKKKTKSGYSTNAEVLEDLSTLHPVPSMVIEYRTLSKLKSTYVDSLISLQKDDGRIHSTFIQTVTRTGRISSADPNLQNIPIRSQLGGELRRYFISDDGWKFIDADYSQIELRVLAHMADDPVMLEAFRENVDIHTKTASEMFHMPIPMVTPTMRSRAKAINFGIVYGMGAFSLAKDTGVSMSEASMYIKEYFETYKNVKIFLDRTVSDAKQSGMVSTMFGRIRYIPEIKQSNKSLAAVGERMAKNTPIQGTAADIIKIAMIRVFNRLNTEGLKSRLILQVHDELIVESPECEVAQASEIVREEMENAVKLSIPIITDLNIAENWLEAK